MNTTHTTNTTQDDTQLVLLVNEFAALARISVKTTQKLIRQGAIRPLPSAANPIRPYRIARSELNRFINPNGGRA